MLKLQRLARSHDRRILDREDRYTTVCSDLTRRNNDDLFCVEINLARPKGQQVEGGFKTHGIDYPPDDAGVSFPIFDPTTASAMRSPARSRMSGAK